MGMVEDCAYRYAKRSLAGIAAVTMVGWSRIIRFAVGTTNLIAPAHHFKVLDAGFLSGEPLKNS